MASFGQSQYGKFVSIQNNSGSADAAAPAGGVYLFASGAAGNSKLYLQNEGQSSLIDLDSVLDIAGDSGTGTVSNSQTLTIAGGTGLDTSAADQTITFSLDLNELGAAAVDVAADSIAIVDATDNSTKKESIADLMTAAAGNGLAASSGVLAVGVDDATIELNSDALRIKDGGVDADALASSVAGNGLAGGGGSALSLDLNELSAAAVAVASDSIAIIDADDNSSKKESIADLVTAMAGDGLGASSGVLAVQVGTNKGLALTSDALEITGSAVAAADVAVGTDTFMFFDADGSVKEESLADYATAIAGDGLAASSGVLAVGVDDSTVELDSDALRVKAAGINVSHLNTAVAGNGLAGGGGSALSLDLNELSAAAVAVAADSIAIIDADDNSSKKESIADLVTAMAGDGLGASSGVLAVQVGTNKGLALTSDALEITGSAVAAADVAVGADSFMFFDADGSVKEESFADYATALAGDGLAASSGVLAVGVDDATIELNSDALRIKDGGVDADALASSVAGNGLSGGGGSALALDLNELSAAAVAVASDSIAIIDADDNSSKKETIADLMTATAGDGLAASSGVLAVQVDDSSLEIDSDSLRVKASGITSAMIADGAVVNADVNASAAIEATKLNFNVDLGGNVQFGTQSDDTVAFAGPIKAGANTIADSGNNAAITLDGSGGFGTLGGFGGGSGISFSSGNGAQFATALTVNKSDGSMANDFKVFGDTAGAYFMYDASADKAIMHNGSSEIMQLGSTTNGYAIEVASLGSDAGKIKAVAFVTYSDESLKEEVTAMDNALDAVMNLNGVEFTWKNSGERDFGFLAQEVKSVIPQAVSVGNDGIHGVDYSRLTSVLVEAVKAQQVQIEELKAILKK